MINYRHFSRTDTVRGKTHHFRCLGIRIGTQDTVQYSTVHLLPDHLGYTDDPALTRPLGPQITRNNRVLWPTTPSMIAAGDPHPSVTYSG